VFTFLWCEPVRVDMGSQERNDEIHRPASDSHYGKLLLEEAHANARFVAGIKKPGLSRADCLR
ncbi:hypothetical protein ACWM1Q_22185, partial [Klebsiella grimontii]